MPLPTNDLVEYSVQVPRDCDSLVLVAPKGQLRHLSGELVWLRNDPIVRALILDILDYAVNACLNVEQPPPGEQLLQLTEKLVRLVNGKETGVEDLSALITYLGPFAARRGSWPVLARATASELPSEFKEFALKSLGVGRWSGVGKKNAAPSSVTELSQQIFLSLEQLLRDPDLPHKWPYGYLGVSAVPPPTLSLESWDFWRKVIADDLTLTYGAPEDAESIRSRRRDFARKQPDYWPSLTGVELDSEMVAKAREKLRRPNTKGLSVESQKPKRIPKWNFADQHPKITAHLNKITGNEVTQSRGLLNLLKREVLKAVKRRIELAEALS